MKKISLQFRSNRKHMKKISLILFALLLFLSCNRNRENEEQYLVILSMDGFRWDYPGLYSTPSLDKIAKEGVKAEGLIPPFPSLTFPSHYTMATGLSPDRHGIVSNTFYDPDRQVFFRMKYREMVEDTFYFKAEPIWATAKNQGLISASFYWVGSEVSAENMKPVYAKKFDSSVPFETRIDTVISWLQLPEEKRPRLLMFYFEEPDAIGHDNGPVSSNTGAMVTYLDSLTGIVHNRLKALPFSRQINFVVLSDHGMAALNPGKTVRLSGTLKQEWIEYIAGHNPFYLVQPKKGYTDSIMAVVRKTGNIKGWHRDSIPAKWKYGTNKRIPEIVLMADSAWSLSLDAETGGYSGGAHGYDPANRDMHGIFYATGPAFRKNIQVEAFSNRNIYLMAARILNITPSENEGEEEVINKILTE